MQKITVINPMGETLSFFNRPPYIFWKLDGVQIPGREMVRSTAPGQDGYTLHGTRLMERVLTLSCHIHGPDGPREVYELRRELMRLLSPGGLSKIVYENDAGEWYVTGVCRSITPEEGAYRCFRTLSIEMECPDPYWYSSNGSSFQMLYIDGGFSFPLRFPIRFGLRGYRQTVMNRCNCTLPLEIWITGRAVNPVILNASTGEFLKVEQTIEEGKTLYINTGFDCQEVSVRDTAGTTEANAFGYLTNDSTLFELAPGENRLEFESDDNSTTATILVAYRERAAGI